MSHANRIATSLVSLVLFAAPASAAPTLLAEFGVEDLNPVLRTPLPGREFWWQVGGVTPSLWEVTVLYRDAVLLQSILTPLGSVFQTTDVIPQPTEFGAGWNCGNCYIHPGPSSGFTADELFAGLPFDPVYGIFGHADVPQLGPGFTGYQVTRAELTLTEAYPFSMNVKLYGEQVVPEPSAWVLFVCWLLFAYLKPRQTRGC